MRLLGLWLLLGGALAGAFSGCQRKSKDQFPGGAVQVQVPWFVDGNYKLEIIDLLSVDDMVALKGWAAKFFMTPKIDGNKVIGPAPKIHTFRNSKGVYIATDDFSLQLLTFYAHLERLAMMDEAVGAKDIGLWPKNVAVQTNFYGKSGQSHNNAFYLGSANVFIFVPYTNPDMPVMINAGVIAHEHFHALFQSMVMEELGLKGFKGIYDPHEQRNGEWFARVSDSNDKKVITLTLKDHYHAMLIRGLNEGLADVWGWVYSSDPYFVGRSLPSMKKARDLKPQDLKPLEQPPDFRITSEQDLMWVVRSFSNDEESMVGKSYDLGIRYARLITSFMEIYVAKRGIENTQGRLLLGKWIINSLKTFQAKYKTLKGEETLGPADYIKNLLTEISDLSPEECNYFLSRLDATDSKKAQIECAN